MSYLWNKINHCVEDFQQQTSVQTASSASVVMFIVLGLIILIGIGITIYAAMLSFKCPGIPMWGKILILISYFLFPGVAPIAFIIFSMVSSTCQGSSVAV